MVSSKMTFYIVVMISLIMLPASAEEESEPHNRVPKRTPFPTRLRRESNRPTALPTASPTITSLPACHEVHNQSECALQSRDCAWYAMKPCNYLQTPVICHEYSYGCQDRREFCDFSQGSTLDRQMQCNAKGFPCTWNRNQAVCFRATKRPTLPPVPHWECSDICLSFASNGICQDGGGENSQTQLCLLGTDCTDCGPRFVQ